jgi:glyoxylase-like metal-dependent hydrolase (beta-lactamase superfamily II)
VYVHELGAPHLIDPSKLLNSTARLYGDDMERLWGEVAAVPEERIRPLAGGESVEGRFRVAYTPGHASHHVSYFDPERGRAFVGDVAAIRIPPAEFILPPTPPPDIDLEAWERSIEAILAWDPASLGITHFGEVADPEAHMESVRSRLHEQAERARELSPEEFERRLREEAEREAGAEVAKAMLQAAPPEQQWLGLDRYWRKRAG